MTKILVKLSVRILIVIMLAAITQVGVISYLICLLTTHFLNVKRILTNVLINLVLYALLTFLLVPNIAPVFGREPAIISDNIRPWNYWITVGLNRNYVSPQLNQALLQISNNLRTHHPSLVAFYLDANFPFWDGYPLLPHLSHNDGKKIDFGYVYSNENGDLLN